jgi:hypothetical protein
MAMQTESDRGAAFRPTADDARPRPVWLHPLVHASVCLGVGAAIVLADTLLF